MSFKRWFNESTEDEQKKLNEEIAESLPPDRAVGKIYHLNRAKGYGFISSTEPALRFRRIFFHWTNLIQDTKTFDFLDVNMDVEFTPIEDDENKWKAFNVKIIIEEKK